MHCAHSPEFSIYVKIYATPSNLKPALHKVYFPEPRISYIQVPVNRIPCTAGTRRIFLGFAGALYQSLPQYLHSEKPLGNLIP